MKLKKTDEVYREVAPYLFEADEPGHEITAEGVDSDGDVYLHWQFAKYVPQAIRDKRQERGYPDADRSYEWSGRGIHLTRKQARKLAKELLKAADSGE